LAQDGRSQSEDSMGEEAVGAVVWTLRCPGRGTKEVFGVQKGILLRLNASGCSLAIAQTFLCRGTKLEKGY